MLTGGEAGLITDSSFGEANPVWRETRRRVRRVLKPLLGCNTIPVVTGFIGQTSGGEVTTLGRGGSDYTATILADALNADEVWIWTDVDGLMTADPRVVEDARVIETLSYAEAEEMAILGAKAMHPRALEPARGKSIPVRIRNTFNPEHPGTLIGGRPKKTRGVVKAVALVRDVGMLTVSGRSLVGKPGMAAKILGLLAAQKIYTLMISQSVLESNISIVVKRNLLEGAKAALASGMAYGDYGLRIDTEEHVSVVAAIGAGMKGTPGVAARVGAEHLLRRPRP